jgi:hypothetical protein
MSYILIPINFELILSICSKNAQNINGDKPNDEVHLQPCGLFCKEALPAVARLVSTSRLRSTVFVILVALGMVNIASTEKHH